jgi:hypothetical protein
VSGSYIYCRNWTGFTDKFPFYDELNSLPDDLIAMQLDSKALAWLRDNRAAVKAHHRERKKRYLEAFEALQRGATDRPSSSPPPQTRKSRRVTCLEAVRGPRQSPLIQRVGRIAGWLNGERFVEVPSPTSILFLGRISNDQLAQELIASFGEYIKSLGWKPIRLHFGLVSLDKIGSVDVARIELEIENLAKRNDELAKIHRDILTAYRELVARTVAIEIDAAPAPIGTVPGTRPPWVVPMTPPVARKERLERAKSELVACLGECKTRWFNDGRDPLKFSWRGLAGRAAELAATLGFSRPPIEYIFLCHPAPHRLFDANPTWTHLSVVRVSDPVGELCAEIAMSANAARASGEADEVPADLSADPLTLQRMEAFLESWCRLVVGLDLSTVRPSLVNYGSRKNSQEIQLFRAQLARELDGRGERTRQEELDDALFTEQLMKDGAEAAFHQQTKDFASRYKIVAQLKTGGVDQPKAPVEGPPHAVPNTRKRLHVFRFTGNMWELRFGEEESSFPDRKGFHILSRLLRFPNEPVQAIELQGLDPRAGADNQSAQEVLTDEAKRRLKVRLAELNEEIGEAKKNRDEAALTRLGSEKEQLDDELRTSLGLGGKSRKLGPRSPGESARIAVRRNLDRVYECLRAAHPPMTRLANHLERSILSEGHDYAYRPESCPAWEFG